MDIGQAGRLEQGCPRRHLSRGFFRKEIDPEGGCDGGCLLLGFAFQAGLSSGHKPDRAGRPELAENLRVFALEAHLAQIDVMLHAQVAGFPVSVIDASSHGSLFLALFRAAVRNAAATQGCF
jgi:hypothetical protein